MSSAPSSVRWMLWLVVLSCTGTSGCIHNHYYGYPPNSVPVATQIGGPVCEVPGPSSGVVVSSSATPHGGISSNVVMDAPAVAATNAPPRILISQPAYQPGAPGVNINWSRWRRTDPESVANVRTEGALDDTTVNR